MTESRRQGRALAVFVAVLLALTATSSTEAANESWRDLHAQFKKTWKTGGLEEPDRRIGLRNKKHEAVRLLAKCHDGRAVPVLLAAHADQLGFLGKLRKAWAERKEAHDKLAPAMERELQARAPQAGEQMMVSPALKEWLNEKGRLEGLYEEVTEEEEVAEHTREAMGQVLNETEGREHEIALKVLLKGAGRGRSPEEREFVRVLGYVKGEVASDALRRFAEDPQPLVAQAALEALGRQNDPRHVDFLLERLDDPRWQIRVSALLGLSFHREARIVDALLDRAEKEDGVLRRHYLVAVARIVEHEAGDLPSTVPAWRTWWRDNREEVGLRWRRGVREGPIEEELSPVRLGTGEGSHTSFYGIPTDSKHIIFVIDVSGSMGEHGGVDEQGKMRIDVVKSELKNAIRSLTSSESDERGASSFNIVTYAAEVQVYKPGKMVVASKRNKDKAFRWIDDLQAFGATNIYDALEQAFSIVDTRRVAKQLAKGADTIFLMTDGKPNRGKVVEPKLIRQEIAKMNRDRRITIHTVGVGSGHNGDFLNGLARENGGQYLAR